jgi:hypothetical protein
MLICEIVKSENEHIRISTEEFKGRKYIDIRIYFENDEGQWKPTRKGVALSPGAVDEVIEGLRQASRKLEGADTE